MVRKHGCRAVMIFGTFLASVGYCASAFVQNLPTLCFTLGFLVGKIFSEICLSPEGGGTAPQKVGVGLESRLVKKISYIYITLQKKKKRVDSIFSNEKGGPRLAN